MRLGRVIAGRLRVHGVKELHHAIDRITSIVFRAKDLHH